MCHKNDVQKALPVLSILLLVLFNQPAHASGSLVVSGGPRDRYARYTEVVVGSDRYYYNRGIFYTGDPGRYIAIEAPIGAIVYSVPPSYERVEIDGVIYFRYGNVYYKPAGRGYEVVRVNRGHGHGYAYGHNNKRDERRDDRRDGHRGR